MLSYLGGHFFGNETKRLVYNTYSAKKYPKSHPPSRNSEKNARKKKIRLKPDIAGEIAT